MMQEFAYNWNESRVEIEGMLRLAPGEEIFMNNPSYPKSAHGPTRS
jgi:hypothetical protein